MLNLSDIITDSIVDGPGIRATVFSQGCPHHCPGCHNAHTWEFGIGHDIEPEAVLSMIRTNPLCRAVTLSGGEPFAQAGEFARLARLLKAAGYEVAAYTGYTFEQLLNGTPEQKQLLESIDVLIDGPFIQAEKSLELAFRGSKNQRILNVPQSLAKGEAVWETSKRWNAEY